MTTIVLAPSETQSVPVTARWLSIIDTTGQFEISAPNLSPVVGRLGRQYDLQDFNQVDFKNNNAEQITVEIEVADIGITQPGSGLVQIENEIQARIIELPPIALNANIESIERIGITSNDTLAALPQISIPANTKRLIIGPRDAVGRKVTLQTISATETTLRVGSNNNIDATRGIILRGSINSLSAAEFATASAIHVYNDSNDEALLAVMEQYIA